MTQNRPVVYLMNDVVNSVEKALQDAAEAHTAGRYESLAAIHESVEAQSLPIGTVAAENVAIALNFLDGWADASNHEWQYYEGIDVDDWPQLAQVIAGSLRQNREIVAPAVLRHFKLKGSTRDPKILAWIKRLLGM